MPSRKNSRDRLASILSEAYESDALHKADSAEIAKTLLRLEVEGLEALSGPNLYTHFIKKRGALPDPQQAEALGLLLGKHVKADNGKFYPQKTGPEKKFDKTRRDRRRDFERQFIASLKLHEAIRLLSEIQIEPTDFQPNPKHTELVAQKLNIAVDWLNRFACEIRSHETCQSIQVSSAPFRYCQQAPSVGHNDN